MSEMSREEFYLNYQDDLLERIDNQPTAFDIDKVIAQLEEMKKRNPFIDNAKDTSIEASVSRQTLDYVIEIIKKSKGDTNE